MSNHGIFRAKYKHIPPQQKSVTETGLTGKVKAAKPTNTAKLKSIMKTSAPHLTCCRINNSDSNESMNISRSSESVPRSCNKTDENENLETNFLKESSEMLALKSPITEKSVTDSGTNSKADLSSSSPSTCKNTKSVKVSVKEKSRSRSLNGLSRKDRETRNTSSPGKEDTKSLNKSSVLDENSESIVQELESKLKCSTAKGFPKLRSSKSVKFNLESEPAQITVTTTELNVRGQQPENLETVGTFTEIPNESTDDDRGTTIAGFLSYLFPLSWPAHINLNPIPAITRSSTGLLVAAYDIGAHIVRTGIQMANSILSDGVDLVEPREDIIQYNGFTIRTYGRELLLQSLYVNCERRNDIRPRTPNRRRPSSANSSTTSIGSCPSCNCIFSSGVNDNGVGNLKMRIVIEVTALPNANRAEHSYLTNGETRVVCEGSRWSLIYGNMMEGLVEILVPNTIQAESIIHHGPIDGIIVVDIP